MKIYVVTRHAEDAELNSVQIFYSVHLTKNSAEKAVEEYRKLPVEPDFEIFEREAN